jgi:hypothetical protein
MPEAAQKSFFVPASEFPVLSTQIAPWSLPPEGSQTTVETLELHDLQPLKL